MAARTIRYTKLALVALPLLAIAACGGSKKSVDQSVDYRSAQSLPPLVKPSDESSLPSGVTFDEPANQAVNDAAPPAAEVGDSADSSTIDSPVEDAVSESASTTGASAISAKVIELGNGASRLEVAAGFDSAWFFLSDSLKTSGVTVFSRNKKAGRIAIGCGALETAPQVTRSGGWSIFSRGKKRGNDYCSLQMTERRGASSVQVLNRAGDEVGSEYSNDIFNRILNN